MVLLTVTPAAKTAIDLYNQLNKSDKTVSHKSSCEDEPSLAAATVGDPISHGQLINISRFLQEHEGELPGHVVETKSESARLDTLLKGSKIWTPPPKPKPEPVCSNLANVLPEHLLTFA